MKALRQPRLIQEEPSLSGPMNRRGIASYPMADPMTHTLHYAPFTARPRRPWPGVASCALAGLAGLLLAYAAWRKLRGSQIYFGVCVLAAAPTGLGLLLALCGLLWPSRRRHALTGLVANLLIAAALLLLALTGHGPD
jgi:hypothetical protein